MMRITTLLFIILTMTNLTVYAMENVQRQRRLSTSSTGEALLFTCKRHKRKDSSHLQMTASFKDETGTKYLLSELKNGKKWLQKKEKNKNSYQKIVSEGEQDILEDALEHFKENFKNKKKVKLIYAEDGWLPMKFVNFILTPKGLLEKEKFKQNKKDTKTEEKKQYLKKEISKHFLKFKCKRNNQNETDIIFHLNDSKYRCSVDKKEEKITKYLPQQMVWIDDSIPLEDYTILQAIQTVFEEKKPEIVMYDKRYNFFFPENKDTETPLRFECSRLESGKITIEHQDKQKTRYSLSIYENETIEEHVQQPSDGQEDDISMPYHMSILLGCISDEFKKLNKNSVKFIYTKEDGLKSENEKKENREK